MKTKRKILEMFYDGHLIEIIRCEINIDYFSKMDPKKIVEYEDKFIAGMPTRKEITAKDKLESLKEELEKHKIYFEIIKEKLKNEK